MPRARRVGDGSEGESLQADEATERAGRNMTAHGGLSADCAPVVFNCTPQQPWSATNIGQFLAALRAAGREFSLGAITQVAVKHDGERGDPCPNCGVNPDAAI